MSYNIKSKVFLTKLLTTGYYKCEREDNGRVTEYFYELKAPTSFSKVEVIGLYDNKITLQSSLQGQVTMLYEIPRGGALFVEWF